MFTIFELFVYKFSAGVTQGGVTKIRNKTIPIINPIVKSSQWPASTYKKGTGCLVFVFKQNEYEDIYHFNTFFRVGSIN